MALYEEIGGYDMIHKVNKSFYDKVYQHPWLSQFFQHIPQERIERQQTDFMVAAFGGPDMYMGREVIPAHLHIMITEEVYNLREQLLEEAFAEVKPPQKLVERWRKIDLAFKNKIIKKSLDECERKLRTEPVLDFPNPFKKVA